MAFGSSDGPGVARVPTVNVAVSTMAIMAALASFNAQADLVPAPTPPTVYINDNTDDGCTTLHDNAGAERDDFRINYKSGDSDCSSWDKRTQTNRAVFYGNTGSGHADSLTLGSELFVNGSATIKNLSVGSTRIKNVSDGTENSDAVNLGQLNSTRVDLSTLTGEISSGAIGLLRQDPLTLKLTVAASTGGNEVDFAGTGGARKLTNVQSGTASGDAVNYGQLSATNTTVANLTSDITLGTIGLLRQDPTTSNLTIASATGGTELNIAGTSGARKITGVHDGDALGDAVNYGQLSATNTTVANLTSDITHGTIGLLHQATPSSNMTIASSTGGTEIDIAGTSGARKITHVRSGTASGDAVNYGQLSATNANLFNLVQNIDKGTIGLLQQTGPNAKLIVASWTGGLEVDFGGSQGGRKLTNVDAGTASGEAVNFDQLNETNLNVASLADSFSKNKSLLEQDESTGKLTVAAATGGTEIDIAGASGSRKITHLLAGSEPEDAVNFAQLSETKATLGGLMNSIDSGTIGLVQQLSATSKVTVAALTGGDEVDVGGTQGTRRLTHVADGVEANDAVNVGQLSAVTSLMSNLNGTVSQLSASTGRSIQGSDRAATSADASVDQGSVSVQGPVLASRAAVAGSTTTPVSGTATTQAVQRTSSVAPAAVTLAAAAGSSGTMASSIAARLGGGATYDAATDTVTAPTYRLQGATHDNVGSALSALDSATTANTTTLTRIANGTVGIVRQEGAASGTGTIRVGQDTGGTRVDLRNNAGERRVLTGIADGELSATSKDAVTGSQLFATNEVVRGIQAGDGIKNFHSSSTGPDAVAKGQGSTAVGGGATTSADNAIALGERASVTAANAVALGAGSVADRGAETYQPMYFNHGATFSSAGTVSVGDQGAERVIANVAPGVRATDAANVGQLKGLSDAVADRLDSMQRTYGRAIASTAALSFQPVQQRPGQFVMSAGVGYFQGYSALGVGGNYLFKSGRQKVYGGVSGSSGGRPVVQVGFSAAFGD